MATITDILNAGGNTLTGTPGETNDISGLDGNDTLIGAELTDVMKGGTGNDTFTGGAGADRVYLEYNAILPDPAQVDVWDDFSLTETDKVDVSDVGETAGSNGSLGIGELDTVLAMTSLVGGAVQISWGATSLRLTTLTALSQLGSTMFVFDTSVFSDTFVLGNTNDLLATNGGNDFLDGGMGNDRLFGEQGNDTVLGGLGNDSVYGGGGNDIVWGDEGVDFLSGGGGNDTLVAGLGNDIIRGGLGADSVKLQYINFNRTSYGTDTWQDFKLVEGDKVDVSSLGATPTNSTQSVGVGELATLEVFSTKTATSTTLNWGLTKLTLTGVTSLTPTMFKFNTSIKADKFILGASADILAAGGGNDTIYGGVGADILFGEQGNDLLDGGAGNDKLYGSIGNDKLVGGLNEDTIEGGAGNDLLDGGANDHIDDLMRGGLGNDTYIVDTNEPGGIGTLAIVDSCVERANEGIDTILFSAADTAFLGVMVMSANIENLINITSVAPASASLFYHVIGNELNNTIIGSTAAGNKLDGKTGDDILYGQSKNDILYGEVGNDTLYGKGGNDELWGNAGKDIFIFDTALSATGNVDTIKFFEAADDTLKLDNLIFTKLTAAGTLSSAMFRIGTAAADANDYLVYDKAGGKLYYDSNGSGAGGATLFAKFEPNTALSYADVVIF